MINQWVIHSIAYVDDYGDPLPNHGNGSQFLPDEVQHKFGAMCLVDTTHMSYKELLDLPYAEYAEIAALARAKNWTAPTQVGNTERYL